MTAETIEIINKIHKYCIGGAIILSFIHFVYLFFKAYQKAAIAEDFTLQEFKRVHQQYSGKRNWFFRIMIRPFLIYLMYALCISAYTIIVFSLKLIW